MRNKLEIIDVNGCVDCLMLAANGELPPENSPEEDKKLENAFVSLADQGFSVCAGDGEGSFSWSSCDICDSKLGGDRFPMHLVKNLS